MRGQCTVTKHQCTTGVFQNTPVVHHRAPKCHSAGAVSGGRLLQRLQRQYEKRDAGTHTVRHTVGKSRHMPHDGAAAY